MEFFKMFSYKLIAGSAETVLSDISSMVVSQSLAIKLFGSTAEALGKSVMVQHDKSFIVGGIFQDVSPKSSYRFDYVISFEDYLEENAWALDWDNNAPRTVLLLREGADRLVVSNKIANYIHLF